MERKTRFELATLALARRCSTPEPLPHVSGAGGGNSPDTLRLASLSPLRCDCRHLAAKSTGLSHDARTLSGSIPCFLELVEGIEPPQPADYKSAALPLSHTSKIKLALDRGLEPRTYRLKSAGCSTIELMKRMINTAIQDYHTLTNNASIIFTFFAEFHEFLL